MHAQCLVEQGNRLVKDSIHAWKAESGRQDWSAALTEICWSVNATWHSAIKTVPYELVFGRKSSWLNHLDHHHQIVYTLEDEATLEEIEAETSYLSSCGKSSATILCIYLLCSRPNWINRTRSPITCPYPPTCFNSWLHPGLLHYSSAKVNCNICKSIHSYLSNFHYRKTNPNPPPIPSYWTIQHHPYFPCR